jgi:hypothetical protein
MLRKTLLTWMHRERPEVDADEEALGEYLLVGAIR